MFVGGSDDNPTVQCNICLALLAKRTSIRRHYENQHDYVFLEDTSEDYIAPEPVHYREVDLVESIQETGGSSQIKCRLCDTKFKSRNCSNIKQHYVKKHKYAFIPQNGKRRMQYNLEQGIPTRTTYETQLISRNRKKLTALAPDPGDMNALEDDWDPNAPEPIKYVYEDLVELIFDSTDYTSQCRLCPRKFKCRKRTNIQEHYATKHNQRFLRERDAKRAKYDFEGIETEGPSEIMGTLETNGYEDNSSDSEEESEMTSQENYDDINSMDTGSEPQTAPLKYVESDLVKIIENNPFCLAQCLLCKVSFKSLTSYPIKKHYTNIHGYTFEIIRNRKKKNKSIAILKEEENANRIAYVESDLVKILEDDPKYQAQCLLCQCLFKKRVTHTIKGHYTVIHGYDFKIIRQRKSQVSQDSVEVQKQETFWGSGDSEDEETRGSRFKTKDRDVSNDRIEYVESDLVKLLENNPKYTCQCLICRICFKDRNSFTIKQHYSLKHGYAFVAIRHRSSQSRLDKLAQRYSANQQEKTLERFVNPKGFADMGHYLRTCVKHHEINQLQFSYWDSETTKLFHDSCQFFFNTNVTGTSMMKHSKALEEKEETTLQIKDRIGEKLFNLKIDIRSKMYRFLVLRVQFVDQFVIQIAQLGIIVVKEKVCSDDFLRSKIRELLKKHELQMSKIFSSTSDFGSISLEMQDNDYERTADDKCLEETLAAQLEKLDCSFRPVRCAAHVIQMAVETGLSIFANEIQDLCQIVRIKRTRLMFQRDKDTKVPPLPDHTRWTSIYLMINRLIKNKETYRPEVEESLFHTMQEIYIALTPLFLLAKKMEAVEYVTGDFVRDILVCENELGAMKGDLPKNLLTALSSSRRLLYENDHFLAAVYMDPRLNNKCHSLLDATQKSRAIQLLLETEKRLEKAGNSGDSSGKWMDLIPSTAAKGSTNVTLPELQERLENLQHQNPPSDDFDVLKYWQYQNVFDAELAELASVVLSVPASKVPVDNVLDAFPEWVFSKG